MGYSHSTKTIQRNQDLLAPLIHKTTHVYVNAEYPHRIAYKIRECLRIATRHKDEFKALADIASKVRVRVVGRNVIVDRPEDYSEVEANYAMMQPQNSILHPSAQVLNAVKSVLAVCAAWLEQLPATNPIVVQNNQLSTLQLKELASWGLKQSPPLMVLSAPTQGTVTLALEDSNVPPEARILP